jgi:hypothetical protein
MVVRTARNKTRKIEAAVGRFLASWVATLIEIVLVLSLVSLRIYRKRRHLAPAAPMCAFRPYDFEGGA